MRNRKRMSPSMLLSLSQQGYGSAERSQPWSTCSEEVDEDKEGHGADWQGLKQPYQEGLTPSMKAITAGCHHAMRPGRACLGAIISSSETRFDWTATLMAINSNTPKLHKRPHRRRTEHVYEGSVKYIHRWFPSRYFNHGVFHRGFHKVR